MAKHVETRDEERLKNGIVNVNMKQHSRQNHGKKKESGMQGAG